MSKKERIIVFILFGVAIYFPIFLHLDYSALYRWDEATNALQAYDMLQDGHFLQRFFLNRPDTWETKPMLLIWIQGISMKLFGYNELAIRLPSAIAVLLTIGLIVRFFARELNDLWGGIFSSLVLLTSAGYVRGHVSRTGDHDALLLFFLVAGFIYFYKFLMGVEEKQKRFFCLFVAALIGGILTKSITGLYFAPGLLIFTIVSKNFVSTIRKRYFWLGVLSFFGVVFGYYFLADYYYPGYLNAVWKMELFPRFFNATEGYKFNEMPEAYHFTKILFDNDFKYYAWFLPLSLLLVWFKKDKKLSNFILAVFITALVFHIVSSNGTYNSWYNAPIFPLLAMIIGAGLSIVLHSFTHFLQLRQFKYHLCTAFFILSVFFLPYQEIILTKCYFKEHWANDDIYGEYFKKLRKEQPELKDFVVYYEVINRHYLFYEKVYNEQYGYRIRSCGAGVNINGCNNKRKARPGDTVMICNEGIKKALKENYSTKTVGSYKACELFVVQKKGHFDLPAKSDESD